MRALTLKQPWIETILHGNKRIENRLKWKGSSFRGTFLLHSSASMNAAYFQSVLIYLDTHQADIDTVMFLPFAAMKKDPRYFGHILGKADVVDVIMPGGHEHVGRGYNPSQAADTLHHMRHDPYYMGGFALVLANVHRIKTPIPYKGALSFFNVPDSVVKNSYWIKLP